MQVLLAVFSGAKKNGRLRLHMVPPSSQSGRSVDNPLTLSFSFHQIILLIQ